MSAEKEIRELASNRRNSAKRIPFYGFLLLLAWLLFWLLNTVAPIPRWLIVVVSLIMGYSFVGEIVNYIVSTRKLRVLQKHSGPP